MIAEDGRLSALVRQCASGGLTLAPAPGEPGWHYSDEEYDRNQRDRPPDRCVPFGELARTQLGVEPQVADVVADDLRRLAVADPLVIGGGGGRKVAEAPHGVLLQDLDHLVDQLLLRGTN